MLNVSESIILGVVSGIATSLVIWVIVSVFKNTVIPWYQSVVYRGVDISGEWVGFWELGDFTNGLGRDKKNSAKDPDLQICLNQSGHIIKGALSVLKHPSGERDTKSFLIEGVFKDGNLILTYQSKDRTRLGTGSSVMKLLRDGKLFKGKWLFINSVDGSVVDNYIHWSRKNV